MKNVFTSMFSLHVWRFPMYLLCLILKCENILWFVLLNLRCILNSECDLFWWLSCKLEKSVFSCWNIPYMLIRSSWLTVLFRLTLKLLIFCLFFHSAPCLRNSHILIKQINLKVLWLLEKLILYHCVMPLLLLLSFSCSKICFVWNTASFLLGGFNMALLIPLLLTIQCL